MYLKTGGKIGCKMIDNKVKIIKNRAAYPAIHSSFFAFFVISTGALAKWRDLKNNNE